MLNVKVIEFNRILTKVYFGGERVLHILTVIRSAYKSDYSLVLSGLRIKLIMLISTLNFKHEQKVGFYF